MHIYIKQCITPINFTNEPGEGLRARGHVTKRTIVDGRESFVYKLCKYHDCTEMRKLDARSRQFFSSSFPFPQLFSKVSYFPNEEKERSRGPTVERDRPAILPDVNRTRWTRIR